MPKKTLLRMLISTLKYYIGSLKFYYVSSFFKFFFIPIKGDQILPFQTLKNNLQQNIEQFQLNDPIRLNRAKQEFKQAISQIQQTFSSLIKEMIESSKKIFQEIEQIDKQFLDLLSSNIEESSNSNLYKISEILQQNHLKFWQHQKQNCYKILDENKHYLISICENVAIKMREKIKTINSEKIGFNVFQNSKLLGINHSDFIYINNEIISKQGNMRFNQREGLIDILGFSQIENAFKAFQIEFQQGQLCYIEDGKILRIEIDNDQNSNKEIITNYDQLCNLKWIGEETETKQKISLWNAYWGKQFLELEGLYDKKGRKQGFWSEPCRNYSIQLQVVYAGNYHNGKKQGKWKLKKKNSKEFVTMQFQVIQSGGGNYSEYGVKEGQWIELCDEILPQQNQLIIDIGKYQDGHKMGCWKKYIYEEFFFIKNKLIGGGEFEFGIKNGKWKEFHYSFKEQLLFINKINRVFLVIFVGYYKNGLKIGKWNIHIKENNEQQLTIGGTYNNLGQKNGYWSELSNCFHQSHFTIFNGQYKNGIKYGKWTIQHKMKQSNQIEIIGGGEYDEQGLRNEDWIEIFQNYDQQNNYCIRYAQITFKGKYINGLKQGQWDILYQNNKMCIFNVRIISGGGNYNNDGEKQGKWTEVHENFNLQACNILYVGNYMQGKKQGQWQMIIQSREEQKQQMYVILLQNSCGSYEQNGLKSGEWIEINQKYEQYNVVYQNGIQKDVDEQQQFIQI
ncbi:unnamed protein product [Paramecium pentaurelia]|uniref:Uncharacterized protein n=1 Tax=Paramecium pentaurelia TaxID=43138 RepID=A0A8S1VJR1_9CILI|nr:unnamed protein product [Paramecium pentaurelia]